MGGVSKPNIELLGKTLFEYVISAFLQSNIDEIVVVCSSDNIQSLKNIGAKLSDNIKYVLGGKTRAESVKNGIGLSNADIFCVHDCARPFITKETINEILETTKKFGAACVCSPVTDTLKYKNPLTNKIETPNRANMFAVQTPQCFKRDLYFKALAELGDKFLEFTDETSIIEHIGAEVEYIKKLETNMKLTALDDVPIAEIIMKQRVK